MSDHKTGTREEWVEARLELLKAEKALTRRGDELARMRQELPWVRIDKEYRFDTDEGAATIRIPNPRIASVSGASMAAFAGRSFWAKTRTAITDIQVTLMTLSTTSISINPMLEPTQQSPYSTPERKVSRQRRRKCCFSGVSS